MGKKNGRSRIKERDDYGALLVYTKPHKDLELWGFDKTLDPDYVVLTVPGPEDAEDIDAVLQIRKATLIKALTQ